ncbi:ATP-binding protein [Planctellipticum variicoloris]|uniref:ATP-binding protein n=1 Tax=Planctellipticum variicoloris TaxID=3064265 RepID=UPI0030138BF3|nr:ATP-binding protein [Planctomycetaceae bacterium SH412]
MVERSARTTWSSADAAESGVLPVRTSSARLLGQRSWWAFALVAALLVFHQALLQPAIARLTTDAPVINVSGRQRMLSQELAKSALAMTAADSPRERERRRDELATTLSEWRLSQHGLQKGDAARQLPGNSSPDVRRAFDELNPHFEAMVSAAESLLSAASPPDPAATRAALGSLLEHESEFLPRMHEIVGLYEADARRHVEQLQRLGLIVMLAILGILVALQLTVVRPAIRLVRREFAESEAQYQRLVESMNDGLVMFDAAGRVQFANRRFGAMLGLPREDVNHKPASVLLADSDRRRFDGLLHHTSGQIGPVEISFQHAAGRTIDTIVSPQGLQNLHGEPQGLLLVVTDMTERKAGEQRSRELLDQLAHANRLKSMGEMAASLAHEINQPLGAIANYAEGALARLPALGHEAGELEAPLRSILRSTLRGGEIIRRARSFSQRRPHCLELESINSLVREVEQLCLPEARRRGVSLELQLGDDLPDVPVDGIQIQQILTNLIQNAFDALSAVEPYRRRVSLTTRLAGDGDVEVRVADTGPGIAFDDAERLFEPFVTTRAEGTGMGLAIARNIATAHGGSLQVESHNDGGAVFRLMLPLHPPALQDLPASRPAEEEAIHA